MRTIPVGDLKPGQRYTKPVFVDDDTLLVPESVPLKEKEIKRLEKWGISSVKTDGSLIRETSGLHDPGLSFFQRAFSSPDQKKVKDFYEGLSKRLNGIHQKIRDQDECDTNDIDDIVGQLVYHLEQNSKDIVQFILYGFQGNAGPVENALNSTILAILVGFNLALPKNKVVNLATAALLHDVGMLRLPDEISGKSGTLTDQEIQLIRTHPIHSYKIVTREMKYTEEIGVAVLQHQERWDGNGYPKKISGTDIILPARIVSVVDSFEAMVSKRPYRTSMIGYTAMRTILSDNARRFDPDILKVFIKTMGIYPIGSIVLLSDASIARVIEINVDSPLKPRVKVIIDAEGKEFPDDDGPVIDLHVEKSVFVAKAVNPNELGKKGES
ncbi:MAG: HD-GYP domain-containing protein [Spirochaetaceae bacterium]|nr:MAG: HD-GYP domain-containing protein [Spirochaetaceae bacterium]